MDVTGASVITAFRLNSLSIATMMVNSTTVKSVKRQSEKIHFTFSNYEHILTINGLS